MSERAVKFLMKLFNMISDVQRMPGECRKGLLVLIFNNKDDVQTSSNYRGIKLISHTMKMGE